MYSYTWCLVGVQGLQLPLGPFLSTLIWRHLLSPEEACASCTLSQSAQASAALETGPSATCATFAPALPGMHVVACHLPCPHR